MTEIEGRKPYENTGIKEGDLITSVGNVSISTTQELVQCINKSEGKSIEITYIRDGKEYKTQIEPTLTNSNEYKLRTLGKRPEQQELEQLLIMNHQPKNLQHLGME